MASLFWPTRYFVKSSATPTIQACDLNQSVSEDYAPANTKYLSAFPCSHELSTDEISSESVPSFKYADSSANDYR